jgi:hypothetical protein
MKEIVITVSDQGEIALETKGFKGRSCVKESQFVKDFLGNELTRELTPAYNEFDPAGEVIGKKFLNLCG